MLSNHCSMEKCVCDTLFAGKPQLEEQWINGFHLSWLPLQVCQITRPTLKIFFIYYLFIRVFFIYCNILVSVIFGDLEFIFLCSKHFLFAEMKSFWQSCLMHNKVIRNHSSSTTLLWISRHTWIVYPKKKMHVAPFIVMVFYKHAYNIYNRLKTRQWTRM